MAQPCDSVNRPPVDFALEYLRSGLSVLSVRTDGSKAPDIGGFWKKYQSELPTEETVRRWYAGERSGLGVGVICGAVSGGLTVIDVEFVDVAEEFRTLVEAESPGLLARLPQVRTPGKDEAGGLHVCFRSATARGTMKLARTTREDAERRTGDAGRTTLIETKGEGGYVVTVGSPPACHPSGRIYQHIAGPPITETPTLTEAEVETLLRCARALSRHAQDAPKPRQGANGQSAGPSVGDDYDARGPDWSSILTPHGWKEARGSGNVRYWTRPGKETGISASTGHCRGSDGGDLLYCFTSNGDPFEDGKSYGRFRATAMLDHRGDLSAAARELAKQGFGEQRPTKPKIHKPEPDPSAPVVRIDTVTLTPKNPRVTPSGRVSLGVAVRREGVLVDTLALTASPPSRAAAVRAVADHVVDPDRIAIGKSLAGLLAWAQEQGERPPEQSHGPTLAELVVEAVEPALDLRFRTQRGTAWSEAQRRELTRGEVVTFTPNWLLQKVATATDAPPDRAGLLRSVKAELEIFWASVVPSLPEQSGAELEEDTAAAQAFRSALEQLWKQPTTFEVDRGSGVGAASVASRASLVSRVRHQSKSKPGAEGKWNQVHQAFEAWWRPVTDEQGEVVVLLALRWELARQVGVPLPGVENQNGLTSLARGYGLLDRDARRKRLGDGGRITVLSPKFSAELLRDAPDVPDEDGDAAEAV